MPTIQFLMWPEKGHMNSSFKLAKSLKSRGHAVVYSQLFMFEEYIRAEELDFTPLFPDLFPRGYQIQQDQNIGLHIEVGKRITQQAIAQHTTSQAFLRNELDTMFARLRPELLVMDTVFGEPLLPVRRQDDPPCILLNTNIRNPYDNLLLPYVKGLTTLFLCPEEFDLPQKLKIPQSHYVEASCDLQRKQKDGFPWDRVDASKKLLYCSLGTQTHWSHRGADHALHQQTVKNFLQAVVDAIAVRPDWQLIMSLGIQLRAEDFQSIPPNALLVNEAPQLEILKKASLAITHGGFSTVKECIFFGVPMLVFPMREDQPANAIRVEHHGLGVVADIETASVESLGFLISKVGCDPGYKSRIDAMREIFLRVECEQPAVTIIEDFLCVKKTQNGFC
jgi:UDP:flavonoid glycosyltransferase YjiC (YdhE family)